MPLGLVCHYVEERKPGVLTNLFENRTLQLGRFESGQYTEERIRNTYLHNARKLREILPRVVAMGVRHLRFSSDLIPLADRVNRAWWDNDDLKKAYKAVGDYCRQHGVRATFHPGQFCVLNSLRDDVVANAVRDLEQHAWIFDACEFDLTPQYPINIHAGSRDRLNELITNIKSLPANVRQRLTLENCETVASAKQLVEVHAATGVPVTFDSHHHVFNDGGLTMREAHDLTLTTWPSGIMPVQHLANTEKALENGSFIERRKHSKRVHSIPEPQLDAIKRREVAVEVEAKDKNLAITQLVSDFQLAAFIA
jgi:UV DNA damage endonuclease